MLFSAEALKLLEEKDRQKARGKKQRSVVNYVCAELEVQFLLTAAAFDDRFKSITVKLTKPVSSKYVSQL